MAQYRVGQLVGKVMKKNNLSGGLKRARAVLLWPEVVGTELAHMTKAQGFKDGVLWVEAEDSVLTNFLTMQRPIFLEKLRERVGDNSVKDLRFVAGKGTGAPPLRTVPDPLPNSDLERLERLVADLPEALRDNARRTAEAIFKARVWRERQGFEPCLICDTPTDHKQVCHVCRDLLNNAQVQAASLRLARDPESAQATLFPHLSADGFGAARYAALEYLEVQMQNLSLELIKNGEGTVRHFLETLAENYLSLKLHKPRSSLNPQDHHHLPERISRVLKG
jgi:predicted nucleic acid-binding Zn ribbon protein